jgi:hypothetical protein
LAGSLGIYHCNRKATTAVPLQLIFSGFSDEEITDRSGWLTQIVYETNAPVYRGCNR